MKVAYDPGVERRRIVLNDAPAAETDDDKPAVVLYYDRDEYGGVGEPRSVRILVCLLLLNLLAFGAPSRAFAQAWCFTQEEALADAVSNFATAQLLQATRCDILIENTAQPVKQTFTKFAQDMMRKYNDTFLRFIEPLENYARRNGISGADFFRLRLVEIRQFVYSQDVTGSTCDAFWRELVRRNESWETFIAAPIGEYDLRRDSFLMCED